MTLQTLQANVAIGEQLFVLKENGQYLPVTPTPGVPGGGAGPAPIAGVDDGAVALAGTGASAGLLVYLRGVAGSVLSWSVSAASWVAAGVVPFRATFYADPAFTGLSTGSASNPFKSVNAAFAAGIALALIGGIVYIPPDATVVENVVFPPTGEWELAAQTRYVPALVAIINGTVNVSCTATARRALSNIQVTGDVTGNAAGGASRFIATNCFLDGALTLTATGGAFWRCGLGVGVFDNGIVGFGGAINGQVTVTGGIYSTGYILFGAFPIGFTQPSTFNSTSFNPGANLTSNAAGANTAALYSCVFSGGPQINAASGTLIVTADGASTAALLASGLTVSAGVTMRTVSSNGPARQTLTNNSAAINLGRFASSQCVINVSETLLAVGTLAAIQAAVTYTDMTGALVTQNVGGTLNGGAGGAIGDKLNASLSFSQNGATNILVQWSGVTTPGALSFQADASVQIVS